jgi:hypothetical protein
MEFCLIDDGRFLPFLYRLRAVIFDLGDFSVVIDIIDMLFLLYMPFFCSFVVQDCIFSHLFHFIFHVY